MEKNNRLFLSVSDADLEKLDALRSELGMNRSQYVRYMIAGQKQVLIPSIKYKALIEKISRIDLSLRVIALKENVEAKDMLLIYAKLEEIKKLLSEGDTKGPGDQKGEEDLWNWK